jgi:hypothetical protein
MKNYLEEEPSVAKRLEALHDEWLKDVQPKH